MYDKNTLGCRLNSYMEVFCLVSKMKYCTLIFVCIHVGCTEDSEFPAWIIIVIILGALLLLGILVLIGIKIFMELRVSEVYIILQFVCSYCIYLVSL